jgi:hypothetical protein
MASRKFQFAQAVINYITSVAQAADGGTDARSVFNDRGYNPGGTDPIIDSDVEGLEITAAELLEGVQFFENLGNMLNNSPIVQKDWDAVVNKLRNDL